MLLPRDVVMVRRYHGIPTDCAVYGGRQRLTDFDGHRSTRRVRETPGAGGVMQIGRADLAVRVECAESTANRRRTSQIVAMNRLPERTRAAVHHQPQAALLVRLELDEVIAAPERRKLDRRVLSTDSFEPIVAEADRRHIVRLRDDRATIPVTRGNSGPSA